jgi:hypothetical protein
VSQLVWVVVVYSSNYPRKVIGPLASQEIAEALARGLSMDYSGSEGKTATALHLEQV